MTTYDLSFSQRQALLGHIRAQLGDLDYNRALHQLGEDGIIDLIVAQASEKVEEANDDRFPWEASARVRQAKRERRKSAFKDAATEALVVLLFVSFLGIIVYQAVMFIAKGIAWIRSTAAWPPGSVNEEIGNGWVVAGDILGITTCVVEAVATDMAWVPFVAYPALLLILFIWKLVRA